MWPRFCELAIGAWLITAAFIWKDQVPDAVRLSDLVSGIAVCLFAAGSLLPRWQRLHLLELPVAVWLLAVGLLWGQDPLPALQNDLLMGMVLPMFAIVPTRSTRPPDKWVKFEADRQQSLGERQTSVCR